MPTKIYVFFGVILFFLVFPFVYFYFLLNNHLSSLLTPQAAYPLIISLGLLLAFFIEKRTKNKMSNDTRHSLFIILLAGLISYALFLFLMTWSRYNNYVSEVIDLFLFHQAIWQLSEFKTPYAWILDQPQFHIWALHFSPIFILLAPLYWFSHNPGLLMVAQATTVISGAIPIYLIAKHHLRTRSIGLALAFAYLAFGGLQFGYAYGFHEIMFFPTVFLWAYYFYIRRKIKLYFFFIFLSLLAKEEVCLSILFWGGYLLFFRRDKLIGSLTIISALLWYILAFNIMIPYFNGGKGFGFWAQYGEGGKSGPLGMITSVLLHPLQFFQTLITPIVKVETFLQTFGSFSFLLFLYPPAFLFIIPALMQKLLTSGIAMGNGAHYSAVIAALVVVATFEALPRLYRYKFINRYVTDKNIFFCVLISYIAFFSNIFYGYRGFSFIPAVHNSLYERGLSEANSQLLDQIINLIPENGTVAAQYQIAPRIKKHYMQVTVWPGMTGKEDFVIINTELLPVLGATGEDYNKYIEKLNNDKSYQLAVNQVGILVYRKKTFNINSF